MLQRGDTFGAYRIVARLTAGGMAQLYLARREGAAGFKRPVALKVIHEHLAREQAFVRMFVDEATLSSKIHDPNVVHVEDLGHANGGLFLAMEYVHGTSLANVLRAARARDRWLTAALVAHVAAQIASGLHAAHEVQGDDGMPLGIVHRDVSPQNVLVAFKGHVKVIDFGIAKALGTSPATAKGSITGKLAYMPPEQARGLALDRRADLYALGIVTWEMLTGRRLFQADNDLALLDRVRSPKVEPPSRHLRGLPRALDDVVMALLARDASSRPSTALDVKRMLLDAVPDSRSLDAHDVAALLRALLPEEIAAQDKVLASAELGDSPIAATSGDLESTNVRVTDAITIERAVEPADAFQQLTVPAVVVPAARQQANARPSSGARPSKASPSPISFPLAVAGMLVLAVVFVALLVRRTGPVAVVEQPPQTAAPLPSLPVVEPAVTALDRPSAQMSATASERVSASASASASANARLPVVVGTRTAAPTRKPLPPAAPKPQCRLVGGVELCE